MQDSGSFFNVCKEYFSNTAMLPLFVIAAVWLWKKWNTEKKQVFLAAGIISGLCVFNVVTYCIIGRVGEGETYYRFFWICPIALFAAMMLSDVLVSIKKEQRMLIILTLFVGYFAFSSRPLTNWINIPENVYQVSDDVIEVSDAIMELTDGACTMIIDNNNLRDEMRQYNARIGYTENLARELSNILHLPNTRYTGRRMIYYFKENNPDYVVLDKRKMYACRLVETGGIVYVSETDNYYIYKTDYSQLTKDDADLAALQDKIGVVCNMEYIQTSETKGQNEYIYISDFGTGKDDEFYRQMVEVINERNSQFVIINARSKDETTWYLEKEEILEDLKIPYYCNDQEFQVVKQGELTICLIDNYAGLSIETIEKFRELKNEKCPFLLVLSEELSEEDEIYTDVMAEDSGVIAILSAREEDNRKAILEEKILQYALATGDKSFFTIMRLKGLEVE